MAPLLSSGQQGLSPAKRDVFLLNAKKKSQKALFYFGAADGN